MLNRMGLVALTEHKQVSWRLIRIENWDKKITRDTQSNLILLFNKTCYFTSSFDFE